MANEKGCLFVSEDAGKNWTTASLDQNVLDAFAHPNGSIFAVTETVNTTSYPPGGDSISTTDKNGVAHYPHDHLLVSRDNGRDWTEITPTLRSAFGLFGIFQDPDHPDLICVRSAEINHTSRTFFYQADDSHYHWKEIPFERWPGDRFPGEDDFYSGGNSIMPAYLENSSSTLIAVRAITPLCQLLPYSGKARL